MEADIVQTDVLVIGAGIAGCRAAIEARDCGSTVVLTTKGLFGRDAGATWMSSNGYQCWGIHPHDTLDVQAEDTIRCGWFLNNQENVYAFLAHAPDGARELLRWGGRYKIKEGRFVTSWQLGCSIPEGRSISPAQWPRGELGYNYARVLPRVVRAKKVNIIEDMFIVDLLTNRDTVIGAIGFNISTGQFTIFKAKATILATGGYQGLYEVTTANVNLTGDGQAMALRAGVDMMDFEFNQTLPAAVWPPDLVGSILPFELMAQLDGQLYNARNERFLSKWDPVNMEHSTRAVLSRAIYHEIKKGKVSPHGGVYVRVTHKPLSFIEGKLKEWEGSRYYNQLKRTGTDLSRDSIETGYAIHYCQGGCAVNTKCETDRTGLYAIGEAASGSKDGSDRMMSNALPYCMAMGIISGREAAQRAENIEMPEVDYTQVEKLQDRASAPLKRRDGLRVYQVKPPFQDLMHRETGYGRTDEGLKFALSEVDRYEREVLPMLWIPNKAKKFNMEWVNTLEFQNLVLVAECVIRGALQRTESRGLHDRLDYPDPNPDWFKNTHLRLLDGELKHWTTPVEFTYWRPEPESVGEPWHKGIQVKEYRGWKAETLYKGDTR